MSVLVVTGVAREARIAAAPGVEAICSGGSPARLRELLRRHDPAKTPVVVSFGIAGGLNPALIPGHVIVADAVVSHVHRRPADGELTDALMGALQSRSDLSVLRASIAGVDRALLDPMSKSAMRARTGAAVVDMESHIAAEYAEEHGLRFAAIRVVCDPAGRSLPPLVNDALNPDGSVSLRGVFGSLRRQPGQIGDLIRLARDSQAAFRALTRAGAVWRQAFPRA